jgi:hypothetical protein
MTWAVRDRVNQITGKPASPGFALHLKWKDDNEYEQESNGKTPQQFMSCARENYMLIWQVDHQVSHFICRGEKCFCPFRCKSKYRQ